MLKNLFVFEQNAADRFNTIQHLFEEHVRKKDATIERKDSSLHLLSACFKLS